MRTNGRYCRLALGVMLLGGIVIFIGWMLARQREATRTSKDYTAGVLDSAPKNTQSTPRQVMPSKPARQWVKGVLAYGSGPGELGMSRHEGTTPAGPESFTVAPDGRILVADLVNHRVLVCEADGTVARTIDFPGIRLNDVIADDRGNIIVYDQRAQTLHHADSSGKIISSLALKPEAIDTRGYFHLARGSIYFADAALHDVLVADFRDGVLSGPPPGMERDAEGIHSESGRIYSVVATKGQALRVAAWDSNSGAVSYELQMAFPDILSARYSGEDRQGRCYVAVERLEAGRVSLEVRTFGLEGEQLSAVHLPENDYFIWTSRLIEASRDGVIVQFLPAENQASLSLLMP